MENQANSKSVILNYGLYLGISGIFVNLVKYAMGALYTTEFYSGGLSFIFLIVFIILGIKKYRTDNGGLVSFGQSVKIGIGISMISALLTILYFFLLTNFLEPEFAQNSIEASRTMYADSFGMSEGQIDEMLAGAEDNFALNMYGGIVIMSLFVGGIVSLIAGAIMKKNEEEQY